MKKHKLFALILACLTVFTLTVTVAASESKPYGEYHIEIDDGEFIDTATAYVTKCSCNPVDNYLMAGIQVQYLVGNEYKWTPGEKTFYYNSGTNIARAERKISKGQINYAKAWIQARCGDGNMISRYPTDTNEP